MNKNSSSENCNAIVLGGGAAGLMCALTAAQRGRHVIVLEKSNQIGKKILMSGGGRCNFTNYSVEPENFLSANPHFCKSALSRYTQWDFIKLVEKHGISFEERKHQQLFCKESANQILMMLENECTQAGVTIHTHCEINSIKPLAAEDSTEKRYQLDISQAGKTPVQQATLICDSLVVATGGLSVPTLGGSSMGYDIARQFDLQLTERRAGLVPFMFTDELKTVCEQLSGVSTDIEVHCNGQRFRESLLFTHRGISGPAILQISSYWLPGNTITINLLPDMNTRAWLCDAKQSKSKSLLKTVVQQKLPRALTEALQELWWPELTEKPLAEISDQVLITIGEKLNVWNLKPSATEGYRTAEVTLGGVDTEGISSKTFEANHTPGLYFIGEVLDVSGHLGGFNFQWAWSSGYVAGLYV
ncbi:MAG: NAD(P)/FAD-dependent oxidoreductase [Gammaproteobacteria bacterium]|nr:NAD(P)/FAD-dependent oxidoreductase [Gammaproteobacteria bacterium]